VVFDPKENQVNATRAVHLWNDTGTVLAPGTISILEEQRNGGARFISQGVFTPMLPDDDQIVPFGEDGNLSVSVLKPSDKKVVSVQETTLVRNPKTQAVEGCLLSIMQQRCTVYTIVNNSAKKHVPKFYIDHTASSEHGGFAIVTETDNQVKKATGFSRYEFALAPLESLEFAVVEEARYMDRISGIPQVKKFIDAQAPTMAPEVLSAETLSELKSMIGRHYILKAMTKLMDADLSVSEQDMRRWREVEGITLSKSLEHSILEYMKCVEKQSKAQREVDLGNEQNATIFENQARLRKNIQSLEKVQNTVLVDRYLKDLNKEEDVLIATKKEMDKNNAEVVRLRRLKTTLRNAIATEARKFKEKFLSLQNQTQANIEKM